MQNLAAKMHELLQKYSDAVVPLFQTVSSDHLLTLKERIVSFSNAGKWSLNRSCPDCMVQCTATDAQKEHHAKFLSGSSAYTVSPEVLDMHAAR